jgi:hypothetical protein
MEIIKTFFGDIIIGNFGSSNGKINYGENMYENEQMKFCEERKKKHKRIS